MFTHTVNNIYNYVITEIFRAFYEEYIEFKRYISNCQSNLNGEKSGQINNHDNSIVTLEKSMTALREENKNLKDKKTTQLTVIKKLIVE